MPSSEKSVQDASVSIIIVPKPPDYIVDDRFKFPKLLAYSLHKHIHIYQLNAGIGNTRLAYKLLNEVDKLWSRHQVEISCSLCSEKYH